MATLVAIVALAASVSMARKKKKNTK